MTTPENCCNQRHLE